MNFLGRIATTGFVVLCGFGLAGCVQEEKTSPSGEAPTEKTAKKAAAVEDCPSCCTPLSRAALLSGGKTKAEPVAAESTEKE